MSTHSYNLSDFKSVRIAGAFDFEISRADSFSVVLEKSWLQNVQVRKEFDTLVVYRPWYDFLGWFLAWTRPSIKVRMPDISRLDVSGACQGSLTGFKSPHEFKLKLHGASRLTGDIAAGDADYDIAGASKLDLASSVNVFRLKLAGASDFRGKLQAGKGDFHIAGAGRISLSGRVGDMALRVAGASQLDLKNLEANNVDARLHGASNCSLNVKAKLDADLAGASNLSYRGNPVMGTIKTAGASTISKA